MFPGWWLAGHLHKPPGDRQDPSAGGRRNRHGNQNLRPVCRQGARLPRTVQGGCSGNCSREGQRGFTRSKKSIYFLATKCIFITENMKILIL